MAIQICSALPVKMFIKIQIVMVLATLCTSFNIQLIQPLPSNKGQLSIYKNGSLSPQYNDTIFEKVSTCVNELFTIIQFNRTENNTIIQIKYEGIIIKKENISLTTKYVSPSPYLQELDEVNSIIRINAGCLGEKTDKNNYFNKLTIQMTVQEENNSSYSSYLIDQQIDKDIQFSFLIGCDKGGRNKKFQFGYIIIALINAAITIGVALHSKIWSIRFKGRPLSFELKWPRFIIFIVIVFAMVIILYFIAADEFKEANNALRYIGVIFGYVFTFICFNEAFFLTRFLKQPIFKFLRRCDLMSVIFSTIMFIIGFFTDSWIYYDMIAIAICVGAIKMLRFSTMKQAFLSMLINVIAISTMAGVLHFILQRSYNDYATELDSPLFIMIPDMVDQLYKKCSWLPVIDVIVPGVFLSFLRTYDQNYNTGWGGVYTVIGNLSFILSTILWVVLQALYPYTIPFSLITYSFLSLSIFIISTKRNQFQTLWQGRFNGANNQISAYLLNGEDQTDRNSFGDMVGQDIIDTVKNDIDKYHQEHVGHSSIKQQMEKNDKEQGRKHRSSIK